ncbi:MAG: hypothetical protein ACSHWU_03905 [Marinicella sp.]
MLSERLIDELGLLRLQSKASLHNNMPETAPVAASKDPLAIQEDQHPSKEIKLDKNEFRLLVKMLQAINHDCIYESMDYDGTTVTYKHPNKTLVFGDVNLIDDAQQMHLSSLKDLLADESLKRPTWEKLKTLK